MLKLIPSGMSSYGPCRKSYGIKPVIVFPGWFVEPLSAQQKETLWILNPKVLPSFLQRTPSQLSSEQIHLAAYHLSRH